MKNLNIRHVSLGVALIASAAVAQIAINRSPIREWGKEKETQKELASKRFERAEKLRTTRNVISGPRRIAQTNPDILYNETVDDGTRINFLISGGSSLSGIAGMRPAAGAPIEAVVACSGYAGGVYANGKIYANNYFSGHGQVLKSQYYVFDIASGKVEKEIDLEADKSRTFDVGAYNPKDGNIYVLGYSTARVPFMSQLDTETGIYTNLIYCPAKVRAMAFDAEGTLYILTLDGDLETFDLVSGIRSVVMRVDEEHISDYSTAGLAFDYHTGELFWIRTGENWQSDLRKINLDTKTVDIISSMNDTCVNVMWVDSPSAPALAPNTISAISADQSKGYNNVTVAFTAPTVTFSGTPLSGTLDVELAIDNVKIGSYEMHPGEKRSVDNIDFKTRGNHKITVSVSNNTGKGPDGSITVFSGIDDPRKVTNTTLEVTDEGVATVAWDAPVIGVNNGYIDPNKLTYDVVRYPDNVKVASAIKETSFTEKLPDILARYYYSITVSCDGNVGEVAESPSAVFGAPLNLPFDREVGGEDFYNLCTIYDFDGDGYTWYEMYGSTACYTGYAEPGYKADDWMILPPVYLEAGNYYVETSISNEDEDNILDFTFGPSLSIDKQKVITTFEAPLAPGDHTAKEYITVDKSGKYFLGYHFRSVSSTGDMLYLTVNTIKVEKGPVGGAPEAVTELSATPFAKGELKATIGFRTPEKAFDGTALTSLERVEISNLSGDIIGTVESPEAGKHYEFVDEKASQGVNTYRVYAVNDKGNGKYSDISVYVGVDVPDMISWLKYNVEDNRIVTFEWGAPPTVGLNGGYVNPDELTYDFCRSEYETEIPYAWHDAMGLKTRKFTWTECQPGCTFGNDQHLYLYGIIPHSVVGEGPLGYTSIILGNPHQAPYRESFSGCNIASEVWGATLVSGQEGLSMVSESAEYGIRPSDNDGGMILFSPAGLSQHALLSSIVELKDMQAPVVMFDMYHPENADENAYLNVQISDNDGDYEPLKQIMAQGSKKSSGWKEHKISLKKYNGSNRLAFALIAAGTGPQSTFAIDNFRICDDLAHDIAIRSLEAPAILDLGETGEFTVTLQSMGLEEIVDYDIDIYADGNKIASAHGKNLASHAVAELPVKVTTSAANAGKEVVYEARVNLDNDLNDKNDRASAVVKVIGSDLPAPQNLTGTISDSGLHLEWDAPLPADKHAAKETFEEATSFSIQAENGWKWIDGDRLVPFGIRDLVYPNNDQPRAFMIWEPSALDDFEGKDTWLPYEGKKCLIAFASSFISTDGDADYEMQSDEWLISPHVAGGTELSFYASSTNAGSTEKFEVMVSYGGRNPEDFTPLGETVVLTSPGWKKYTYKLPVDAAYFALHSITNGNEGFAVMYDNFEYTAGFNETEFIGYNLYVNGLRVNTSPIEILEADIDFDSEKDYNVGVSALYFEGESTATSRSFVSGMGSVSDSSVSVSGYNGTIIVKGAENCIVTVYDTLGRCIYSRMASGNNTISVAKGVYVVVVGGKSYKVIVK